MFCVFFFNGGIKHSTEKVTLSNATARTGTTTGVTIRDGDIHHLQHTIHVGDSEVRRHRAGETRHIPRLRGATDLILSAKSENNRKGGGGRRDEMPR